ncbi:SNF2 family N-terminal domain-containing protein [Infundibulicybe gibba]|nr:SNF2 family N-terminal domain-containing protein [Infundibulicybe gibba]
MSSSLAPSSPAPFEASSVAASTAPTSPPPEDSSGGEESKTYFDDEDAERRYTRLQFVLEKSAVYSSILKARMDQDKEAQMLAFNTRKKESTTSTSRKGSSNKRVRADDNGVKAGAKRRKGETGVVREDDEVEEPPIFQQPSLITGAKLKNYQLEGLQWMVSLDQNGISGILADEMGLGKTLQTIAFSAYLRERQNYRPFLVVCPLSVLHNWLDEYAKFAPTIPVCMYHGTPAERAELRRTVMIPPGKTIPKPKGKKTRVRAAKKAKPITRAKPEPRAPTRRGAARKGRFRKYVESSDSEDNDEEQEEEQEEEEEPESEHESKPRPSQVGPAFPVVVTTYEMIIKDRVHLAEYNWGYIVVDEGHRLKNLDCKLMKEIKKYKSAGRMILTGTPLHNNLSELWSLLNFILPDIFDDVDAFQEWFNLPTMQSNLGSERSSQIIGSLHAILKPFLLRRLKGDVETTLPPKKEYVLYAPLTVQQREAYDQVLDGSLRSYLIGKAPVEEAPPPPESLDGPRRLRSRGKEGSRKSYLVDGDDDEYFELLENGEVDERGVKAKKSKEDLEQLARNHQLKTASEIYLLAMRVATDGVIAKQVNNMRLQNTVMQLRKVCSHPFLFKWPLDPKTQQPVLDEQLLNTSGKMMVLDRLLQELFKRKHKVLLFSQFTTMLDIIEDWACEFMGWKICRIDGSTSPMDRREQMNQFQTGGDAPDAPILFLLSTRAGGLGINLVAADTVIFYDQDWNPQMDAQAQDRAHRIGQKRPVLIFRLVSAHTIETKIMERATEKKKLEALVIAKGKFKTPAAAVRHGKPETMAEMAAALLKLEGEKINVVPNTAEGKASVLSDEDLDMLLDRRPEVFADRGKGWTSTRDAQDGENSAAALGKKTAFAVYDGPVDEGNDALAKMLGEDVE